MRKHAIVILLAASMIVGGCGWFGRSAKPIGTIQTNSVEGNGMALTIELPKRFFVAGEDVRIRIIARNTSKEPIAFEVPTSGLYKVTILRNTHMGWRWVNQYPQAAMKVKSDWTLQPGQTVKFNQVIPVGRDWPMGEPLKLVAELVGGPELKCPMIVEATAK